MSSTTPESERSGMAQQPITGVVQPQHNQPIRPSATSSSTPSSTSQLPTRTEPPAAQPQPPPMATTPVQQPLPSQEQQQPSVPPPQPAHMHQQPQPPSVTQQQQQQQQPHLATATPPPPPRSVSNLSDETQQQQQQQQPASPKTQQRQMKEKLRERYRLQPDPNQATYSPRQEHAQRYQNVAAEHLVENPVGDPGMAKWKSSFWRRAGQMQAALGDLSGIESWQSQGRTTEAYADLAYNEAESRQRLGEASWINGEYNVLMGKLTNAVGYVAGDPEMQAKAQLRAREGQEEINKLKR